MKAITLRNIPPELQRILEEEATSSGTSLNKAVLRMLGKAAGLEQSGKRRYHDLDDMIGLWSLEEAGEFEKELADQRRVDNEFWE